MVERTAGKHWLLPHERWFGRFAGRATNPPVGGSRWAFQQNYGPEGDVLMAAIAADIIAAGIFLLIGVILLAFSRSTGLLATAGYWLMGLGILSALLAIVRTVQCAHAGRVFRAGKPFVSATRPSARGRCPGRRTYPAARPGRSYAALGGGWLCRVLLPSGLVAVVVPTVGYLGDRIEARSPQAGHLWWPGRSMRTLQGTVA
jgi:hypothetical protein